MNQAIFKQLLIRTDLLEGEEEPVFAQIRSLSGSNPAARTQRPRNGQDPRSSGGLGSNVGQLVRPSGLEPPRTVKSTRPSTSFAHAIYVRPRPDRPFCEDLRTHRTHRTK
jgi:hypothetical protein